MADVLVKLLVLLLLDFLFGSRPQRRRLVDPLVLDLRRRILVLAERQRSDFTRIYGYAVASILFMHFLINVGMVLGLAPVIGIPLPFLSAGGSSLVGFTLLVAILLRLDAERSYVLR